MHWSVSWLNLGIHPVIIFYCEDYTNLQTLKRVEEKRLKRFNSDSKEVNKSKQDWKKENIVRGKPQDKEPRINS